MKTNADVDTTEEKLDIQYLSNPNKMQTTQTFNKLYKRVC